MGEVHQLLMKHGLTEVRRSFFGEEKHGRLCVEAAHAVLSDERFQIGIAHAGFAMAALPHRRIVDPVWERDGGPIKLLVESGLDSSRNPIGVPYGAIARMILLYLQTQAVKTQSRDVELGNSMNAWLTAMNISVGGKTYQMVREQARRISRCRLTFFNRTADHEFVSNGAFVRDAIFPLEEATVGQGRLWQEVVRLDESFYQSLIDHPLPLRDVAVAQISNRSMAIDIYIWLAYRLHVLERPIDVSWAALRNQFGPGYKELRFFRRDMLPSLKLALSVYPEAQVIIDETRGLTLHPSAPPVAERRLSTC
ncbi:replication protein RepA [Kozakia baliensis]|uniref:replication protein RepA n=1 Tax=Kozakia baliensis TaxID=153496 RepID=UPI00087DBB9A|nr:replication protein RepA [Kozakia baliensis]AOX21739.1 pirin [Kozakia baliensis]